MALHPSKLRLLTLLLLLPTHRALRPRNLPTHKIPSNGPHRPAPTWCKAMRARPRPATAACKRDRRTMRCADGTYEMFSQMKQDFYIYTTHFRYLNRSGVYLDVAANDPIGISNTFFFDACLGWDGVCVEANPQYLAGLHRVRSCALVPTCLSDVDGRKVEFGLHSALSGVMGENKNERGVWKKGAGTVLEMKCSTVEKELELYEVEVVDYFSLDVEGHELQVLKGVDFEKVVFNVITVEAREERVGPIQTLLEEAGYVRHVPTVDERSFKAGRLNEDVVFIHKDVVWGKPV